MFKLGVGGCMEERQNRRLERQIIKNMEKAKAEKQELTSPRTSRKIMTADMAAFSSV